MNSRKMVVKATKAVMSRIPHLPFSIGAYEEVVETVINAVKPDIRREVLIEVSADIERGTANIINSFGMEPPPENYQLLIKERNLMARELRRRSEL